MDELRKLLAWSHRLHDGVANSLLFNPLHKVADNRIIHVSIQKGKPHLADRVSYVILGERLLPSKA